jgi:predicted Zn finger-like uncharacterized protein
MIISCPKCSAKFNVSDNAIGPAGRFVRCSSCQNEWVATNPNTATEPQPAPANPKPQQTALEESIERKLHSPKTIKRYVAPTIPIYERVLPKFLLRIGTLTAVALLVSISLVYFRGAIITKVPYSSGLYEFAGSYENNEIKIIHIDGKIQDIQSAKNDFSETEVIIEVKVKNFSEGPMRLQIVRFSVFDKYRRFLGEYFMDMAKELAPGESTTIDGRLNRIPKETMFVAVDIGNKSDIYLRDLQSIVKFNGN